MPDKLHEMLARVVIDGSAEDEAFWLIDVQ
jgi:hypothetical protein